jgi:hypothetical protein
MRRLLRWFFCDPKTGRVVIAQRPNLPLTIFLVTVAVRVLVHPHGDVGDVVRTIGTVSLVWWSLDEVLRGSSPFRRVLGAVVLAATLVV